MDKVWVAAADRVRIEIGPRDASGGARSTERGVQFYDDVLSFADSFPPRMMRLLQMVAGGPPGTAGELAAHLGRSPDRVIVDLMSLWGRGLIRPVDRLASKD